MMTELHDAIRSALGKAFPAVKTCETFPRFMKKLTVPAILIESADLTPVADPGTEQLAVDARFRAYVVFDQTDPSADLNAANLAAAVAVAVHQASRFGCKVGPAKVINVDPADFKPALHGFAAWCVEWTHEMHLGDSVWDGEGIPVTQIMLGWSPDIGFGHEDDYEQVAGGE